MYSWLEKKRFIEKLWVWFVLQIQYTTTHKRQLMSCPLTPKFLWWRCINTSTCTKCALHGYTILFCFVSVVYKKLFQHGNTSSFSFFLQQKGFLNFKEWTLQEQCPPVKEVFKESTWRHGHRSLLEIFSQLHLFNHTVLKQKITITAKKVPGKLKKLKQSLEDGGVNKFIPQKAKKLFKELEETGNINIRVFTATHISYNEMWEGKFLEAHSFRWVNQNDVMYLKFELLKNGWILKWGSPQLTLISSTIW